MDGQEGKKKKKKKMGGPGCSASLRSVLDPDRAPPEPERAFAPEDIKTHARFLEHMLLEEHVANERGNHQSNAFEGFVAFWPRKLPSYVPPIEPTATVTIGTDHALEAAMQDAARSAVDPKVVIASWARAAASGAAPADGPYPLLIVVGPAYWTPHAVAFLITQTADGRHECFYANTGLGALRCGERDRAIRTTLKWRGGQIIHLIEFARRTDLSDVQYKLFIKFIMTLPGYTDTCVAWTPDVNADRMLTLAQYAESAGTIVSFPQRGGTCTYNCILWLVGGVMMSAAGGMDAAVEAEKEMKKRGMRALASFVADDAGCMQTRDCLRVMEAVAHTYAATAWCASEVAQLQTAIAAGFATMHTALTNRASRSTYIATLTHRVKSEASVPIAFDLDYYPFDSITAAGVWAAEAYKWLRIELRRGSRINEPIYHLFVHKARDVLCVSPMPDSNAIPPSTPTDVVRIVTFLDRCRGAIRCETARGMLTRCARLAAAALAAQLAKDGTKARPCSHPSRLASQRPCASSSSLPWVVEEHRALSREAQPLLGELMAGDDMGVGTSAADVGSAFAEIAVGDLILDVYARGFMSRETWAAVSRVMGDTTRAAFNLAVAFMDAWSQTKASYTKKLHFEQIGSEISYHSNSGQAQDIRMREHRQTPDLEPGHEGRAKAFHASEATRLRMAEYMRLSADDMSNGARTASTADRTGSESASESTDESTPAMAIVIDETENVVQSDVAQLASWADAESAAWTQSVAYFPDGVRNPHLRGGGRQYRYHETVERMARARSMAYCAAKYLEPSSRDACDISNLDLIVADRRADADTLTKTMVAIFSGDVGTLATRMQAQEGESDVITRLAIQYAVRSYRTHKIISAMTPNAAQFGEPIVPLTPLRMTRENGTRGSHTSGGEWILSVRQPPTGAFAGSAYVQMHDPCRRLVFKSTGGVIGAVSHALRMANVPCLHWQYESPTPRVVGHGAEADDEVDETRISEIEVNNAVIRFESTDASLKAELRAGPKSPDGPVYDIDPAPSEWSSLWYTTVLAAVFPVRERATGALSLAVFVCTDESHVMARESESVYFTAHTSAKPQLIETQRGAHFVVHFDAAGVMPVCTPMQAHTLFCAYSRGSICAVRLMPMLAARRSELPETATPSCIYGGYARHALEYVGELGEVDSVADRTRNLESSADRAWCIATLEGTGVGIPRPAQSTSPEPRARDAQPKRMQQGPMAGVVVEQDARGVFRLITPAGDVGLDLAPHKRRLEQMRAACRAKWRFWFGTIVYGADERATAFLAASIAARENLLKGGDERLGVMMAEGCVEPYACLPGSDRETFEAASGRFLTIGQMFLFKKLVDNRRMAVQLNMGFGKSAVIVPMLVLELIKKRRVVIVTQPAHLVAPALRIIAAAVAARPFVGDTAIMVTSATANLEQAAAECSATPAHSRRVIVCSSSDLQGALSHSSIRTREMYTKQKHRAHIADEIDEASDPLTCERSETIGTPMSHYDTSVCALTYHRAVCALVSGTESTGSDQDAHKRTEWHARLAAVHAATRHRKLNVNFGLVATEGVHIAVPYKYARTPVLDARYSDVNAAGVFTARAALHACVQGTLPVSGVHALRRALEESVGTDRARAVLEQVNTTAAGEIPAQKITREHRLFMLYAVLVALPQVVCYAEEKVTSFLDVLGIADAFTGFSGTMALKIPVPAGSDLRSKFMPQSDAYGALNVDRDALGNALVEANIQKATCVPVAGEHDARRAQSVIDVLQGVTDGRDRPDGPKRQMVVVDASGEFGVMPETPGLLRRGRLFTEDGTLEKETPQSRWLVYFDHRHSRGTDAALDADADGWIVVDWATSTITAAAQAMYRLRGVDYGRQTVSFVVCGFPADSISGYTLYAQLVQNETERAKRTVARSDLQLKRASRHYSGESKRFVHAVVHAPGAETGNHQQTQMQTQEQEQSQSRSDTCLSVEGASAEYYHIDPLVVYDTKATNPDSALRPSLLDTSVHVSPLLVYTDREHELAFFVMTPEPAHNTSTKARTTVGMCALVELWARLTPAGPASLRRKPAAGTRSAYNARGELLLGPHADKGDVLFGTFLCGRSLLREDQETLLLYMRKRYADPQQQVAIHKVLKCLVSARLLTPHAGLLRPLFVTSAWVTVTRNAVDPVAAFVESVMSAASFGRPRTRPRLARRFV